jgi:hypothetical protein
MKKSLAPLKKKLWELCKELVRKRDGKVCVVCGKAIATKAGWHTGHFIPSSTCGAYLRYDLRNLHSSCYNCNINLGGNGALFYRSLEARYGKEFVEAIFRDKNKSVKADIIFYTEKIEQYKELTKLSRKKLTKYTIGID